MTEISLEKRINNKINEIFYHHFKKLPNKIAVAVSGGSDSIGLLHILDQILPKNISIFCLTVDHKFRENSKKDALFVKDFCEKISQKNKRKISCYILVSPLEESPKSNIENDLRQIRYNLLINFCQINKIKYLFSGHHQNDVAENFLIRLFRGSGIDGLAAISSINKINNIYLIRPILEINKNELIQYLRKNNLSWIEDESNKDEKFLRNKIRNFLTTLPESNIINQRIAKAAQEILESKEILHNHTKRNFPKIFKKIDSNLVMDLDKFKQLNKNQATRYLALALMQISDNIYKPRLKKLIRIYDLIISDDLKKEEFYGCLLKRTSDNEITISKF